MSLVPTVFIGVGGMGVAIVKKARRKFLAMVRDRKDFPSEFYQFVVMDPVPPRDPDSVTGPSRFPDQFAVTMKGYNASDVEHCKPQPGFEDVNKWYYLNYQTVPCHNGYLQVRLNGRFGLKLSCYEPNRAGESTVVQAIQSAIREMGNITVTKTGHSRPCVNAVLCGSIAGGTGSGTLLDLGFLVRRIAMLEGRDSEIYGVLVLPDVMQMAVGDSESLQANSYAFLRELNWYMCEPSHAANALRKVAYAQQMGYGVEVNEASRDNLPTPLPMNHAFLVSQRAENNATIRSFELVQDMVAEALYLATAGTDIADYVANAKPGQMWPIAGSSEERPVCFGGLGSYTLRFPADRVCEYLVQRAVSTLLSDRIMRPQEAETEGDTWYSRLMQDDDVPLSRSDVEKRIREAMPKHGLDYSDKYGLQGRESLAAYLEDVYNGAAAVFHPKSRVMTGLQMAADGYVQKVCARLDEDLQAILDEPENYNAIGEAAVYLAKVQRYCDGLLSKTEEERVSAKERTLAEEAVYRKGQAREWIAKDSPTRVGLAEKDTMWPFKGAFRDGVAQATEQIISGLEGWRICEQLNQLYRRIRDYAHLLKLPLRFVQEDVADGIKKGYDANPDAPLVGARSTLEANGLEVLVCHEPKDVKTLVQPRISFFAQNPDVVSKAYRGALVSMLGPLKELLKSMRAELAIVPSDQESYLALRLPKYQQILEDILSGIVGQTVTGELKAKFTIGHALWYAAGAAGHAADPLGYVTQRLGDVLSGARVYSGMPEQAINRYGLKLATTPTRAVLLHRDAFNQAITALAGTGQLFNVTPHIPTGATCIELDDPFRISSVMARTGMPLLAISEIESYHGCYNAVRRMVKGKPLHTDRRFEEGELDKDFRLPTVEVLGTTTDPDIYLFVLAEQDWWHDLAEYKNDPNDAWAGDLKPLVRKTTGKRHYYTWSCGAGEDSALGRENAQFAFISDKKGLKAEIRSHLAPRWSESFTPARKKQLLTALKQEKERLAVDSDYNDLRRAYRNEARVIGDRLASDNLDL